MFSLLFFLRHATNCYTLLKFIEKPTLWTKATEQYASIFLHDLCKRKIKCCNRAQAVCPKKNYFYSTLAKGC